MGASEINKLAPVSPAFSPSKTLPQIDRSKADPAIVKAAEGMETMFIDYMMQVMRQTVPKNEMDLESPASQIYRGMLDSEYAEMAAKRGGIGLAEQIIAYLDSPRYHQVRTGEPSPGIGGTHESSTQTDERKSDIRSNSD